MNIRARGGGGGADVASPLVRGEPQRTRAVQGADEEDDWPEVNIQGVIVPAAVLVGLVVITVRGFWSILHSPGASVGDDLSSHFAEISFFGKTLGQGKLDLWFPDTQLGYPLLMTYTPLPLILFSPILALARGDLDLELYLFRVSLMGLWLLAPSAWYRGSRWMGLDRLQASCAAVLWMCVSDQHSFGVGVNSLLGKGLLAHFLACLLLPLWLGAAAKRLSSLQASMSADAAANANAWRWTTALAASKMHGGDAMAAVCLALLLMANSFTALFALMAGGVLVLSTAQDAPQVLLLALWLLRMLLAAVVCNLFWIFHFIFHVGYQGGLPFKHWPNFRGDTPQSIAQYVLGGKCFDAIGYPLCTLLFLAGFFACRPSPDPHSHRHCPAADPPIRRSDPPGRAAPGLDAAATFGSGVDDEGEASVGAQLQAWLGQLGSRVGPVLAALGSVGDRMRVRGQACSALRGVAVLSLVMMHGRSNLPLTYRLLPFHDDVEAIRYTIGLHAAGIMLGGIAAAALIKSLWAAIEAVSSQQFFRLCSFFTLFFVSLALLAKTVDARVQAMPYAKAKSLDVHAKGFRAAADHLKAWAVAHAGAEGSDGGRYLVHKSGASHLSLNMLARVSERPGFISYSRGYHDTLSFWYLEHFQWFASTFRLFNVRHVVVAHSNVTQVPPFIRTTHPACPAGMSLSNCTTLYGDGYSVHEVVGEFGYFDLVAAPVVVCSELGLKAAALRHLLNNLTRPLFERGIVPVLAGSRCVHSHAEHEAMMGGRRDEAEWGVRAGADGSGSKLMSILVHQDNNRHVEKVALKGPAELLAAVNKYSTYTLQVSGSYKMKGGMEHIAAQAAVAADKDLAFHHGPAMRKACALVEERGSTARYSVKLRCVKGHRVLPTDMVLFKMSYHPLWTASATIGSSSSPPTPLRTLHMAPNLQGIFVWEVEAAVQAGHEVTIQFAFHTPREQYVLALVGFGVLALLASKALLSAKETEAEIQAGHGIKDE